MFKERMWLGKRFREAIHPTPIVQRLNECILKLKVQLQRLEQTSSHLHQRDQALHQKCVSALQQKNTELASMYANECAEIRKIAKIILCSQLALEQVTLRLQTTREFGNLAYNMTPVAHVVKTIRSQLQGVLPQVSMQLSEVNESLEEIVLDAGEVTETSFNTNIPTEESERILREANMVAEEQMKNQFPDIPTSAVHEAKMS